ncbi:hypothetical protein Q8A73_010581 [Channa argus]|nr:hypothetical protein Q8A73_010581 [Channa argus]
MDKTENITDQATSTACTDLENILKGLNSLSDCMDQLALQTQLKLCDLIVCVGCPSKLAFLKHPRGTETAAPSLTTKNRVLQATADNSGSALKSCGISKQLHQRGLNFMAAGLLVSHTQVREEGSGEEGMINHAQTPQDPQACLGEYMSPPGGSWHRSTDEDNIRAITHLLETVADL